MADRSLKLTFLMGRLRAIGIAALLWAKDGVTGLAAMLTAADCGYCSLAAGSALCRSAGLAANPCMSKLHPQDQRSVKVPCSGKDESTALGVRSKQEQERQEANEGLTQRVQHTAATASQ